MILTVDSTVLALLINPSARPPEDPETGQPLKHAKARIEALLENLTSSDTLIIPTPVLAEILVKAGEGGPAMLSKLQTYARIRIASFNQRAAIETAHMEREARELGSKRGISKQPWQKVKFDRQIIAIARVNGSDAIYSDDENLTKFARSLGLTCKSSYDIPVPEEAPDLFNDTTTDQS